MQAPSSITAMEALSEGQRTALVHLLADDDPDVFRHIHDTIVAQGPAARSWLEEYLLSDDPRTRRRVRAILSQLKADEADNAFLSFCMTQGDRLDLEQGLVLLASTTYPDFNPDGYRALLDGYAEEIRNRVADFSHPHRVLGTINRLLFIQMGFRGNTADYYDPDDSYINRVLDRRLGNPIALSCVYLCVCRRLGLPIVGISLPGHFICRFQNAEHEIYIDPFNGGRFLTRTDCVHHLVRANCNLNDDYLGPTSPKKTLFRTVNNLHQIYQQRNETRASLRIRGYLLALANASHLVGKSPSS